MIRNFSLPLAPVIAVLLTSAPPAGAQLDNPDPPSDTVTRFDVTQGVPGGSPMDTVRKLPHRDSYLVTPDRTGQIKLNVGVDHTFTGSVETRLVDNHGMLMHTFTAGSGSYNINCIQFHPPFHLLVIGPSGQAVESQTLVTPQVIHGPDGTGFIGGPLTSDYGPGIPPFMAHTAAVPRGGSEGDNGEEGSASCGSCSSCDQSTANEGEGVRADGSGTGAEGSGSGERSMNSGAVAVGGAFEAVQPAGTSANGDSKTELDALFDTATGVEHKDIKVHGNGDATVVRDTNGCITSVETWSCYSKVEEVTTTFGTAIKISQWKLKSHADASAAPYRTILFENTDTNEVTRTNTFDAHTVETVWRYTPGTAPKWEVVTGNGLRREELVREDDGTDPALLVLRRKHYERAAGATGEAAVLVSDVRQTYQRQSFGWEKTKLEVFGMDNGPLISTWEYWQSNEDANGQGLLKRYVAPDGFEIDRTYDENAGVHTMTANSSPLNGDSGLQTQDVFTSNSSGSSTTRTQWVGSASNVTLSVAGTWSGGGGSNFSLRTFDGRGGFVDTNGVVHPFGSDHGGQPAESQPAANYGERVQRVRDPVTKTLTITHRTGAISGGVVVDGTATEVMIDRFGAVMYRGSWDILTNIILEYTQVSTTDALGRPSAIDYLFDSGPYWTEYLSYDCCGVTSFTDRDGIATNYTYDDLRRRITSTSRGITHQTVYDGLVVRTNRKADSGGTDFTTYTEVSNEERNVGGTVSISRSRSPQDGTLVASETVTRKYRNPAALFPNPYSLPSGIGLRVETVLPLVADDGASTPSERDDYFFDGRLYETRGNLGTNLRYSYSMDDVGGTTYLTRRTVRIDSGTAREGSVSRSDWAGNATHTSTFGAAITLHYYNSDELLVKSVDGDGVTWLYAYNNLRERTIEALDVNGNGTIDYGIDQVTSRETKPVNNGTADVLRTVTKLWKPGAGVGSPTVVSYSEVTPDGLRLWERSFPTAGSGYGVSSTVRTVGTTTNPGDYTLTTTAQDGTISRTYYDNGYLGAETLWEVGSSPPALLNFTVTSVTTPGFISGTAYGYDVLGRIGTIVDARTGTTSVLLHSAARDEVAGTMDPGGRVTGFTYDHRARKKTVDAPDTSNPAGGSFANITATSYFPDGLVKLVDGGALYKSAYTYDYAGRMKTLTTYGDTTATTTWSYSLSTGFLWTKNYPDGYDSDSSSDPGPYYYYTSAGRLKKRQWARGNTTRYDYDPGGRLSHVRYFTAATTQVAVNAGATGNDPLTPDSTFVFDSLGRIEEATNAFSSTEYGYHADHLALATETVSIDPDGSGSRAAVSRTLERGRDSLLRATGYQFKNGASVEAQTTYSWNSSHSRLDKVSGLHAGSSREFSYSYTSRSYSLPSGIAGPSHSVATTWMTDRDALDTRINAKLDTTVISGYDYTLNDLGQRSGVSLSGSQFAGSPAVGWEYDSRGQVVTADRSGGTLGDRGYKYDGIGNRYRSSRNSTNPDTASGSNLAVYRQGTTGTSAEGGNALNQYRRLGLYGATGVNQTYDLDGNQENGRYPNLSTGDRHWDGENQLYLAEVGSVDQYFAYDPFGRRVASYQGSGSTMSGTVYFYDQWNVVAEYSIGAATYPLSRTYTWGTDLSGIFQGAGGVGGLLAVEIESGGDAGVYYPTFDGNGNVSEYVDALGYVVAHFEYDPFGDEIVATGAKVALFNYRFSTKPLESVTGYYYFGYRFYDSGTGRWPSRDPIGERGGENLYGFVYNNPVDWIDLLGLNPTLPAQRAAVLAALNKATAEFNRLNRLSREAARRCGKGSAEAQAAKRKLLKAQAEKRKRERQLKELEDQAKKRLRDNAKDKYEKQLKDHGEKSLEKSRKKLERRLQEHKDKLEKYKAEGGYTSSVEREIRNFQNEIDAITNILGR